MSESDEDEIAGGAILVQPDPPRRGTFTLLIPADMCWETTPLAGGLRLDFRPRTAEEQREAARQGAR